MKFSCSFVALATLFTVSTVSALPYEYEGTGWCTAPTGTVVGTGVNYYHDFIITYATFTEASCDAFCTQWTQGLRGFSWAFDACFCWYEDEYAPGGSNTAAECPYTAADLPNDCVHVFDGTGDIADAWLEPGQSDLLECYDYIPFTTEATGDPHFRTWKNEHFEFHGQCDLVMTKVENFVEEEGLDLEIQLRTQIVRYWSYIKSAVIRIGNDILEVQGSPERYVLNYWNNFEHNGELATVGGFPVSINNNKEIFTIDLGSKYPGQKIEIKTFKEFVGVKIIGATEESFGNAIGMMGDFKTGKTVGRDGTTELHDFNDLGLEWQVLPSDGKLFHEVARPQFPELCYLPEDPRGDRTRRLDESNITEEAAEAACAKLADEFDRKGCVYDILATQDMDMVGAY